MGLYDRDYYREEEPTGLRAMGPRSMVAAIIWINVIIFIVDWLTPSVDAESHLLDHYMALQPDVLTHPWMWYQLVTHGFAHAPLDSPMFIWHIAFNMWGLWLFGRDVEMVYGPKEFLRIYLGLVVMAGLTWVVVQMATGGRSPVLGASGAVVGIMVLFVLHFPHRTFTLLFLPMVPIKAWVLGLIYVGMDLMGVFGRGESRTAYEAHLAGAAWAFLYFRSGIRLTPFTSLSLFTFSNWLRRRPKLRVHRPDQPSHQLDEEADRILEKLYREGEASLTARERSILEDYSRRMRQKHR